MNIPKVHTSSIRLQAGAYKAMISSAAKAKSALLADDEDSLSTTGLFVGRMVETSLIDENDSGNVDRGESGKIMKVLLLDRFDQGKRANTSSNPDGINPTILLRGDILARV
jgi:hypothetical protein